MSYFLMKIVSGLLASREVVYGFVEEGPVTYLLDTLYHIFPKFQDMNRSLMAYIGNEPNIDYYPIWSTLVIRNSVICYHLLGLPKTGLLVL